MRLIVVFIALVWSIFITGCSDNQSNHGGDASVTTCPDEQPIGPEVGCDLSEVCGYGVECCCNVCVVAVICNCINGVFECAETGVCDDMQCEPDGGTDGGT